MPPLARALIVALLLLGCSLASAQGAGDEWLEVVSPRTRVLYANPGLEEYAVRVAQRAERALDVLTGLFGSVPPVTVIRLDDATDVYGAIAPPLPRPRVVMPALFPAVPQVDLGNRDPLYALLLHELTHSVQLSYLERPPGVARLPRLGLVGETVAPLPPGWLLEGLAVWVAGRHAPGANVLDARTRGVLHTLSLEGEWPSLEDVSLLSYSEWPAGEARYLLGGAFVGYLVETYGWDSLLVSLREANSGWYPLPFEAAWQRATGERLEAAWRDWSERVEAQALQRLRGSELDAGAPLLTGGGRAGTVLATDPDGNRVAWRPARGGLLLSRLDGDATLDESEQVLPAHLSPLAITWLGSDRLVYSRLVPAAADRYIDLFELDLETGRSRRLTHGARTRFPAAGPDGCLLYVRDVVADGSTVWRSCGAGEAQPVYRAPDGVHVVGMAVGQRGQLALSLWRNGFVDLALLDEGRLRWLTQDSAQDLDPQWHSEELLFRSDRTGIFELYALRPDEDDVRRLTTSLGGAFAPAAAGTRVVYARLGGSGFDLATTPVERTVERLALLREPLPERLAFDSEAELRSYRPLSSLAPYGWLPQFGLEGGSPSASASLFGQDDSGDHSYALTVGFDPSLAGPLAGAWANLRYDYRRIDAFDLFQRPPPSGFGVRLGSWPFAPHLRTATETAAGISLDAWSRDWLGSWAALLHLRAGALHLPSHGGIQPDVRLDLVASRRYVDLWGYGTSGPRAAAHLLWSASPDGGSAGAWVDASRVLPPRRELPFTTSYSLRLGYRPAPPVPLDLTEWAAFVGVSARHSWPVAWRYADGLVALERFTMESRLHWAFDGHGYGAADVSLWADTMIRYGAPVSLGATVGYAGGFWYRLGLRLPL